MKLDTDCVVHPFRVNGRPIGRVHYMAHERKFITIVSVPFRYRLIALFRRGWFFAWTYTPEEAAELVPWFKQHAARDGSE